MPGRYERELALLVTGKDVSASRTLRGVNSEINKLSGIAGKAGTNVARNLERGVVVGATAAAGAIGYAVKQAIDFESSSASVAKTVGEGWEEIVAANRELARTIPVDVNELNEISAAAGAMGVAKDDIDDFTRTLALLTETADDVDSEAGATFLGHLRTNMKLTGAEIVHTGDLVTHLGNNSAATEGEILAMAEGVSGAAGFINASIDDVVAWSAAMASAGEEAEAGGSAIQRVWIDSAKFVSQGGDELETLAKISGVSMATFRKNFEKDGAGTLATFMTQLGELSEAQQLAILESLGWDDIRITRALGKLLANTDNLTNAYDQTGEAAGAAAREAEVRFATTAAQLEILENNVNDAAITIGSELLPVINELASEGVDWLTDHQPEIKAFSEDLAAGIRDAVTWARQLDWDAIGDALGAGADAAKGIVEAFMAMPPGLQALLAGGFVANKVTGGALGDLAGMGLKGLLSGAGGLLGGMGGKAGAIGGLVSRVAATPVFVVNWPIGFGAGGAGGLAGGAGGKGSRFGGAATGALVGAAVLAVGAAVDTYFQVNAASTNQAGDIHNTLRTSLAGPNTVEDLRTKLAAIDTGISQIQSNPLLVLVQGEALTELQAMRQEVVAELNESHTLEGTIRDSLTREEDATRAEVRKSTEATYQGLEQSRLAIDRSTIRTESAMGRAREAIVEGRGATERGLANVASVTREQAAAIRDIRIPAPIVNISVRQSVTVRETVHQQQVSIKYGRVAS